MECYFSFISVDIIDRIILKLCVPVIKTSTNPINDIRVFVGLTNLTLSFQDVVKRPFKRFVFYYKIEKKAIYSYIDDKYLVKIVWWYIVRTYLKVIKKGEEDGLPISFHEGLNEQLTL